MKTGEEKKKIPYCMNFLFRCHPTPVVMHRSDCGSWRGRGRGPHPQPFHAVHILFGSLWLWSNYSCQHQKLLFGFFGPLQCIIEKPRACVSLWMHAALPWIWGWPPPNKFVDFNSLCQKIFQNWLHFLRQGPFWAVSLLLKSTKYQQVFLESEQVERLR